MRIPYLNVDKNVVRWKFEEKLPRAKTVRRLAKHVLIIWSHDPGIEFSITYDVHAAAELKKEHNN